MKFWWLDSFDISHYRYDKEYDITVKISGRVNDPRLLDELMKYENNEIFSELMEEFIIKAVKQTKIKNLIK